MSDEQDKRLYAHYTALIGGSIKSGNPVRDELIVSDAKKHLADLIKKRPDIDFEEKEDYPEENINLPPEERKPKTKSKEKK